MWKTSSRAENDEIKVIALRNGNGDHGCVLGSQLRNCTSQECVRYSLLAIAKIIIVLCIVTVRGQQCKKISSHLVWSPCKIECYSGLSGLDSIINIVRDRRLGLFGHVARFSRDVPTFNILSVCCDSGDGYPPDSLGGAQVDVLELHGLITSLQTLACLWHLCHHVWTTVTASLIAITDGLMWRLQAVQNAAARLITVTRRRDHITPILRQLHWLPVRQRIEFKLGMLVFKTLYMVQPHSTWSMTISSSLPPVDVNFDHQTSTLGLQINRVNVTINAINDKSRLNILIGKNETI